MDRASFWKEIQRSRGSWCLQHIPNAYLWRKLEFWTRCPLSNRWASKYNFSNFQFWLNSNLDFQERGSQSKTSRISIPNKFLHERYLNWGHIDYQSQKHNQCNFYSWEKPYFLHWRFTQHWRISDKILREWAIWEMSWKSKG